jgi:two-component system KDP operon response regulator KdpE
MNNYQGTILLVDDQEAMRRALRTTLSSFGFSIYEAGSGEEAIETVRSKTVDAVLLDVNMPGMGGISACTALRFASPALPILMLTVRDGQEDIVKALDAGADDYITKPFHVRELTARLGAAVRRSRILSPPTKIFRTGEIEVDPTRRTVRKGGLPVRLTPKEFDLLHCLMRHTGMPVSHARLLREVWGPEYGNELEYLRTFIRQLRLKLENDPANPAYLLTEPCIGYRLSDAAGMD